MVRPHELQCFHGIGHQLGVHGCDGCCGLIFGGLVDQEQERIIKLLEQASHEFEQYDFDAVGLTNAVIKLIKGETE